MPSKALPAAESCWWLQKPDAFYFFSNGTSTFVGVRELESGISILVLVLVLVLELIAVGRMLFADSWKLRIRFITIAFGSLRECQAVSTLELLEDTEAWRLLDQLGAALYSLMKRAR